MPIYEFKCTKCEYEFEDFKNWVIYNNKSVIQGVPNLTRCPKCQEIAKQIIGCSNLLLKFNGSGFYKTDYKKGE